MQQMAKLEDITFGTMKFDEYNESVLEASGHDKDMKGIENKQEQKVQIDNKKGDFTSAFYKRFDSK